MNVKKQYCLIVNQDAGIFYIAFSNIYFLHAIGSMAQGMLQHSIVFFGALRRWVGTQLYAVMRETIGIIIKKQEQFDFSNSWLHGYWLH